MWYRLGQLEDPKSQLNTKEVTQKEIDTAKAILSITDEIDDSELKKNIAESKEAFVNLKKTSELLNSIADSVPLEFVKPTLRQYATDLNSQAESYLTAIAAINYTNMPDDKKEQFKSFAKSVGGVPTDYDSAIKFVKNLDAKDYVYVINLVGDFMPLGPGGKVALTPIKIADYRANWIPKLEQDVAKYKAAQNKFDTAKDQKTKDQAWNEITQSISGILGVISNALIDIAVFVAAAAVVLALVAPWLAAASAAIFAVGLAMQAFSTTLDQNSPFYYKNVNSLPSNFALGVSRMFEGLPFSESTTEAKKFPKVTNKSSSEEQLTTLTELFPSMDPTINPVARVIKAYEESIYSYLRDNFNTYNKNSWLNKYNSPKTANLINQPLNVILEYAKDTFGNKYPWLKQPDTIEYQNFARYLTSVKAVLVEKSPAPSKRSIAAGLIETALKSQMTNQFSAPLIREMANKYNAGNVYNFLNRKNVEIIDLLSREQSNQNFAKRFNVRPGSAGSAGVDSIKLDITNLKKILNFWK
jgi:hypothetical protein